MLDIESARELYWKIETSAKDPVTQFVVNKERDDLKAIHGRNLNLILETASSLGIRYLYLGVKEWCGCEKIRIKSRKYPSFGTTCAVWELAKAVGAKTSCGNDDQVQIDSTETDGLCTYLYIGEDNAGFAWDTHKKRTLSASEEFSMKFSYVVERAKKRRQYAQEFPLPG